jgi:hypothetical protein
LRNSTASNNTAVGFCALRSNTTGCCNVALGRNALSLNTTGTHNTAIGDNALNSNTTGIYNTTVGSQSMYSSTTGRCNTAVGNCSMRSNTGGSLNSVLGDRALRLNTTGNCNVAVGYAAQQSANGVNNTIAVGSSACTSATTGHTVWGTSANNVCNCVYAAWSTVSDCRDKTNIQTLPSKLGLDLIKKLRPVAFNWDHRDTYVRECSYEYGEKDGTLTSTKEHYGLIAQELKSTLEELNVKFDGLGHDDGKDAYRLTYEELIAPIIKAIQELDQRLTTVEEKVG